MVLKFWLFILEYVYVFVNIFLNVFRIGNDILDDVWLMDKIIELFVFIMNFIFLLIKYNNVLVVFW